MKGIIPVALATLVCSMLSNPSCARGGAGAFAGGGGGLNGGASRGGFAGGGRVGANSIPSTGGMSMSASRSGGFQGRGGGRQGSGNNRYLGSPFWGFGTGYGGYYYPGGTYGTTITQPPDHHFDEDLQKEDHRRQKLSTSAFVKNYSWGKPEYGAYVAAKRSTAQVAAKRPTAKQKTRTY